VQAETRAMIAGLPRALHNSSLRHSGRAKRDHESGKYLKIRKFFKTLHPFQSIEFDEKKKELPIPGNLLFHHFGRGPKFGSQQSSCHSGLDPESKKYLKTRIPPGSDPGSTGMTKLVVS
jgi:hypothetical protein